MFDYQTGKTGQYLLETEFQFFASPEWGMKTERHRI
jgi:hypothetical protein